MTLVELLITYQKYISELESSRVKQVLSQFGYIDLADLLLSYHEKPEDIESSTLYQWYKEYDDLIWQTFKTEIEDKIIQAINNNLSIENCLSIITIDPLTIEFNAFEQTKSVLNQLIENNIF